METSLLSSVTASDHNLYFYFLFLNVLFVSLKAVKPDSLI